MKLSLLFLFAIFIFMSQLGAAVNNGIYDVEFTSTPEVRSSEVTTAVAEVAPAAQAPPVTEAPRPPSRPETPAPSAPVRDYSVTAAGNSVDFDERLVNVRSCGSLVFISGKKTTKNSDDCDTLQTASSFVETLMRQIPLCTAEAVRGSGVRKPIKQTKVFTAGSVRRGEDPSGDRSLHYAARAIDIYQIDVIFQDNTSLKVPMTSGSRTNPFYTKFNDCWERETVATMRRLYPQKTLCHSYDGLIDCSRRDHRDHIHASLPYCPKKDGYNSY